MEQLKNARQLRRDYDHANLDHVEEINRVQTHSKDFLIAPGRVVESMQCEGRIKKGLGRMCKARTRRSRFYQAHLNSNQNLKSQNRNSECWFGVVLR